MRKVDVTTGDILATYRSHAQAADSVRTDYPLANKQGIQQAASGKRDTMYGFRWEPIDDLKKEAADGKRVEKKATLKRKRVLVQNITKGEEYNVMNGAEAAKIIGIKQLQVSRALTGRRASCVFEGKGSQFSVKYASE